VATAVTGFSTVQFPDAPAYLLGAHALAETGQYPRRTDPMLHIFRPPGYSAFLAAVTLGHPDRIPVAKLANDALGAFAALLVAALSARIFRRRGLAIATGFLAAICPTQVLVAVDIQTEPLFIALLLCAGYLLLAAADRPSSNLAVAAGAALAAAALTRSSALVLAPLLAAALWDRRYPFRARAHIALSAFLGFGAVLLPWTVRNALVFHELIVVNDGAGCVFYGRNADVALLAANARNREELDRAALQIQETLRNRIASLSAQVRDSPGTLSRALTRAALDERRANPEGTVRLLTRKAITWLRPYPDPRFWPPWAVAGVGAYFVTLFLLAGIGLARAPRPGVRAFCIAMLVTSMLVHVALEVNWRYRTTYWDPILLLYAAFGAASLISRPPASAVAA
jgi:4-amino-4-deoxy-L-arabinose transferase-like glycosyltransferase